MARRRFVGANNVPKIKQPEVVLPRLPLRKYALRQISEFVLIELIDNTVLKHPDVDRLMFVTMIGRSSLNPKHRVAFKTYGPTCGKSLRRFSSSGRPPSAVRSAISMKASARPKRCT